MFARKTIDRITGNVMASAAVGSALILIVIAAALAVRSAPLFWSVPFTDLFLGSTWMPDDGHFGFLVPILGTLFVTGIAMVIAIPLSLLSAIYLAEYAPERVRAKLLPLIDLLAGIPPVIFGVVGVLVVVPAVAFLAANIGPLGIPFFGTTEYNTGFSVLAGGIVLAIMVFPIIISVSEQVLRSVPAEIREASLGMGATRWQTIKHVGLRLAFPGIGAAIILGFARAFGETMAVLMVVGNVAIIPVSVFDPAYPLPALIANNYGEMMSIPLYDSALLFAALLLMIVVLAFTVFARLILIRIERGMAYG
jgi:phosphate transport system permease protein